MVTVIFSSTIGMPSALMLSSGLSIFSWASLSPPLPSQELSAAVAAKAAVEESTVRRVRGCMVIDSSCAHHRRTSQWTGTRRPGLVTRGTRAHSALPRPLPTPFMGCLLCFHVLRQTDLLQRLHIVIPFRQRDLARQERIASVVNVLVDIISDRGHHLRLFCGECECRPHIVDRIFFHELGTLDRLRRVLNAAEPFIRRPSGVAPTPVQGVRLQSIADGLPVGDLWEKLIPTVDFLEALPLDAQEEHSSACLAVPEVHPPRSFDRMLTPIRHHEVSAPHELRTHCMPHRGVPGRFRQRAKRDIVLTLISEEACRCLRRAACEQSVRTERIEFCSVDRENILEDQPSTIQTVQIFEHFTVFVRYREIPELATALVQVDFPSRSPL